MILDNKFPPDPRVENEALTLIKDGHEVFLFCLSYCKKFIPIETHKGINVVRFYCNKLTYKFSALAYTLPFYHIIMKRKVEQFIIQNSIDVIHVHDIQIARSVFWLKNKFDGKIILDLHENRPEIMKFYRHVNRLSGKLLIYPKVWKRFEYKYIQIADKVIVVTEAAKNYYLKEIKSLDKEKFIITPNTSSSLFTTNFKINSDILTKFENKQVILYLGETGLRRGLLDVIRAIPKIIKSHKDVVLVIVGKSKDDELLKHEAEKLRLTNHVIFEGWKDFSLFQSYLKIAKIGISPLHRNIHHDTTYANKLFQYLSFGIPILVSNSTAQKDLVEKYNCGLIHKEKNSEDIAKKLLRLLNDTDIYTSFQANAKYATKEFLNWETTSMPLKQFYTQLKSNS